MSFWSRIGNVWRGDRLSREIDEEMEAHIAEAVEAGRDPDEARRAFGSALRHREESRDIRLMPWLDSLRADMVFGWRQLKRRKVTAAAAVLSLGLAIGACTAAFRLIDALLLRPLPVAHPERLYAVLRTGTGPHGKPAVGDSWAYPAFTLMRAAVKHQAELIAVSPAERLDVTFNGGHDVEKAYLQFVSGWMFQSFGLRPAAGRLFTQNDDRTPGAHPQAVLSYDFWTRRFGRDPNVIGRTFRVGSAAAFPGSEQGELYEIIGVAEGPFTGTERGTITDLFVPTMMHPGVTHDDWTWIRILAQLKPAVEAEPVRAKLNATSYAFEENRAKGFTGMTPQAVAAYLAQTTVLEPAAAGASGLQREYRRSLLALGVLVLLVLGIACANVANLMTAQAAARAREMAMRVSIGAGRSRLVQLVLIESAEIALLASAAGALFAWWSAPFVVRMISTSENPARLALPADWRVLGFGVALTLAVTLLFGLAPALRASNVRPAGALKGGEDPHARRRLMKGLIAAQVAFCVLVLFVAGLFTATFQRLSNRPIGFSAGRLLLLDTVTERGQPLVLWNQVADHLRRMPGVESVALAGWPLLGGPAWNGFVSVNGAPPAPELAYFLSVSPGWLETMRLPLLAGRDFRRTDATPGAAVVNETFARQFLSGQNPIGVRFAKQDLRFEVIGLVRDAPYGNVRESILPVAYVPLQQVDAQGLARPIDSATILVRTASENPLALASTLRREVPAARPEFRVNNVRTQEGLVRAQTVRERLLAMLALFFGGVALLLAGVGLYGVLDYSVVQKRREFGIRIAIGAPASAIVRGVLAEVFPMIVLGACAGLALGLASVRYIEALLYDVSATDPGMLARPWVIIFAVALVAALPATIRALRIDPVTMLRAE